MKKFHWESRSVCENVTSLTILIPIYFSKTQQLLNTLHISSKNWIRTDNGIVGFIMDTAIVSVRHNSTVILRCFTVICSKNGRVLCTSDFFYICTIDGIEYKGNSVFGTLSGYQQKRKHDNYVRSLMFAS